MKASLQFPNGFLNFDKKRSLKCVGGSVVEFSPAARETVVRFPANASVKNLEYFYALNGFKC